MQDILDATNLIDDTPFTPDRNKPSSDNDANKIENVEAPLNEDAFVEDNPAQQINIQHTSEQPNDDTQAAATSSLDPRQTEEQSMDDLKFQ